MAGEPLSNSTPFHCGTYRLRDTLRLSTRDERDAHASLNQKIVTTSALLQQDD